VLRAALGQAERDELVGRNVAKLVRVPFPRPKTPRIWSLEEAQRFLESSQRNADPLHAAYVLSLVLGLRRGETLGLAWEDVDLNAGEVRIRWQLQRAGGQLVRRPTKTVSSDAVLPLPQVCIDALRSHRALENRRRLEAGPAWHNSGLVFTTRYGLPLDPRNFHRMFKERAVAAGVPVVSVHSTRLVCASLLVELEVHPRVAMQVLRHSRIGVTMDIYSQVAAVGTRDALSRLGSLLSE
jgi:integrase